MGRIEDFRLFGLTKVNRNAEGGVERLADDQIEAALHVGWELPVAVTPAEEGPYAFDSDFNLLPFVHILPSTELGARGLRGVLEIKRLGVENATGAVAAAKLMIMGVVPPLELSGVVLTLPTTTGERVFAAPSPDHSLMICSEAGFSIPEHLAGLAAS